MKKICVVLIVYLCILLMLPVQAKENEAEKNMNLSAESAVLMESSTGKIIFEKEKEIAKPPASVTKIMTLLLIFEDLKSEKIKLNDQVSVSSYAASMGGSQVFLEEGEIQTVETLIKCISVSSANDACVAMAECLEGSESAFVERMNKKAKELGMKNTHFVNCCGLDVDGHLTTALDIAIMSRELTTKHPEIFQYSTIWMDEFTHKTAKGESVFGLSNTNKLIRNYEGCNGLKTGSTGKAKFCLSATAARNNISLIAVVMGCPDSKSRNADVTKMFDYGFANLFLYEDEDPMGEWKVADVKGGEKNFVSIHAGEKFSYVMLKKEGEKEISKKVKVVGQIQAPVKEKEVLGEIEYLLDGEVIGSIPIYASECVKEKSYLFSLKHLWKQVKLDT